MVSDVLGIPVYDGDFIAFPYPSSVNNLRMNVGMIHKRNAKHVIIKYKDSYGDLVFTHLASPDEFVRVDRFMVDKDVRDFLSADE